MLSVGQNARKVLIICSKLINYILIGRNFFEIVQFFSSRNFKQAKTIDICLKTTKTIQFKFITVKNFWILHRKAINASF